jgi:hypothetical protein
MWVLRGYEKHGDSLVREVQVPSRRTQVVRKLMRRPLTDAMYDSYPVTTAIAKRLSKYIDESLDLEMLDYFLDLDSESL